MPLEKAYLDRMHIAEAAIPGDWASLGPFFADNSVYESPAITVTEIEIPGEVTVPVRVYRAVSNTSTTSPALVWFHGGAFIGGDLDMKEADVVSREIAEKAGAVVVSVDYRLCNDGVTFPAPQNDGLAAVAWVQQNSGQLGLGEKVFVGGASAGACLSGSIVQMLRDKNLQQVAGALLIYPVCHADDWEFSEWHKERLAVLPPAIGFPDEFRKNLNTRVMGKPISEATGHDFPGHATDFSNLPPHLIVNNEYDDLAPSGEKYALDLAHSAVKVTTYTEPGVLHGHLNKNPAEVAGTRNTIANMVQFILAN